MRLFDVFSNTVFKRPSWTYLEVKRDLHKEKMHLEKMSIVLLGKVPQEYQ